MNSHHSNELTTIVTTDLTFLRNLAMKMVDIVVNGYILITVLILSLLVVFVASIILDVAWRITIIFCDSIIEGRIKDLNHQRIIMYKTN